MKRPVDLTALIADGRKVQQFTPTLKWSGDPRAELRAQADETADLILYGPIGGWFGKSAEEVLAELREMPASLKTLRVHINSPGGNVFDGLAIYNTLLRFHARVETIIESVAASIASVIALAGQTVTMEPASMLMIHEPHALALGRADDMRKMADLLDKVSDVLTDVYMTRSEESRKQVRAWMTAETWFKPDEAKAAGFVDTIAEQRQPVPDPGPAPDPKPEPEPEPAEPKQLAAPWRRNLAARELALISAGGD